MNYQHQWSMKAVICTNRCFVAWTMAIGGFFNVSLQGEKKHCSYDVSATQRLDLTSQVLQAERNPESKAVPSLELSSLSPKPKPSPTCNTRPLPQLCSRMNSKSLPAVSVGAGHQRGSVTLSSRDEFPASLQSHSFLGGRGIKSQR